MDELTHTKNINKEVASVKISKLPRGGNDLPPQGSLASAGDNPGFRQALPDNAYPNSRPNNSAPDRLSQDSLDAVLLRLNRQNQDERRDLEFELMNEGSLTVVRVSDRHTGELIRQIPEKEVVDLARKLNAKEPLQLFNALV